MKIKENIDHKDEEKIEQKLVKVMRFAIGFIVGNILCLGLIYGGVPSPGARVLFPIGHLENPHLLLIIAPIFGIIFGVLLNTIWKHV
jgi:hypothetical protein